MPSAPEHERDLACDGGRLECEDGCDCAPPARERLLVVRTVSPDGVERDRAPARETR